GGEADEVGEEDGDKAALGCGSGRPYGGGRDLTLERSAALTAEELVGLVRSTADLAGCAERLAALCAELSAFAVLRAAALAGHAVTSSRCAAPARSSHGRASRLSKVSRASASSGSASPIRPCSTSHSACSSSVTAR